MEALKAPSSVRALGQIADPAVYRVLISIAKKRTRNYDDARELVREAMMRVIDPDDMPWDETKVSFVSHMDFVMKHLWGRKQRRAVFEQLQDGAELDGTTASSNPGADEELDHRRSLAVRETLYTQLFALAEARSPRAKDCLLLARGGTAKPEEQAAALRCPVAEIYEAHRFLHRSGIQLRAEWESAEQVRMAAERARRKMPGKESRP